MKALGFIFRAFKHLNAIVMKVVVATGWAQKLGAITFEILIKCRLHGNRPGRLWKMDDDEGEIAMFPGVCKV